MAYDKLIDSAQLDSALTATADAIRAKTGGSAKIAWDAAKGFADAVGTLGKVATGTFVPAAYNSTITVSGLGFRPSTVLIVVDFPEGDTGVEGDALFIEYKNGYTWCAYAIADHETEEYQDENGETVTDCSAYLYTYTDGDVDVTANDDGFAAVGGTYYQGSWASGREYTYYAF